MTRRYIVRKRQNQILYFETFLTAGILSLILWTYFKYHWAYMIITFGVFMFVFIYAFFEWRLFRYIVTVVFSMAYGIIAFFIGRVIDNETFTAGVIFAFIAYFISLIAHKDHFDFLSNAKLIEYEKHNY
jgi:hypothetical protein